MIGLSFPDSFFSARAAAKLPQQGFASYRAHGPIWRFVIICFFQLFTAANFFKIFLFIFIRKYRHSACSSKKPVIPADHCPRSLMPHLKSVLVLHTDRTCHDSNNNKADISHSRVLPSLCIFRTVFHSHQYQFFHRLKNLSSSASVRFLGPFI